MRLALLALLALTGCRTSARVVTTTPRPPPPVVIVADVSPPVMRPEPVVEPAPPAPCPFPTVYFAFDSAELGTEALTALGEFAARASGPVVVSGHADERGSEAYNLVLSRRRADAVAARLSVPVTVEAFGESRPAALGGGEAAWARNRRVEVSR